MRELLARLGNPERELDTIHVVGTKGKSTATRRLAATIGGRAYTSPHVSGWHERLQTDPDGFERAIERVRPAAEELGATQFEILTAAAFADFAASGVEGRGDRGGPRRTARRDERHRRARRPPHERRPRAHRGARRHARGDRAREARRRPAGRGRRPPRRGVRASRPGQRRARRRRARRGRRVPRPRRRARRRRACRGASRCAAARSGTARTRPRRSTGCSSDSRSRALTSSSPRSSATRTQTGCSSRLARAGSTLVATESSNDRALSAAELAELAAPHFDRVESVPEPHAARVRALELAGQDGRILVTGSLYLLADLYARRASVSRMRA